MARKAWYVLGVMGHRKTSTRPSNGSPGIRVILTPPLLARLDALVDREVGETRSDVIRRALKEHMERKG